MKYGVRCISQCQEFLTISGWKKTERGVENWCGSPDVYDDINQAYHHLARITWPGQTLYMVEEYIP